jgi:hypothetical protein
MYRRILAVLFIGIVSATPAASQATSLLSAEALAEMAPRQNSSAAQGFARQSLHVIGGALVGAGIGYFTSHVVYNDWEKTANSSFSEKRRTYSISGAAIGALTGLFVGRGSGARGAVGGTPSLRSRSERTELILRDELEASSASNVFEAVQSLRPNWLVIRGVHNFTETGALSGGERSLTSTPGAPQIRTYLDWATLGEVEHLRQLPLLDVQSIQFLTPAQAALRFGAGHTHGAIVVLTGVAPGSGEGAVVR